MMPVDRIRCTLHVWPSAADHPQSALVKHVFFLMGHDHLNSNETCPSASSQWHGRELACIFPMIARPDSAHPAHQVMSFERILCTLHVWPSVAGHHLSGLVKHVFFLVGHYHLSSNEACPSASSQWPAGSWHVSSPLLHALNQHTPLIR